MTIRVHREPGVETLAWALIAPAMTVVLGLGLYPLLYSLWISVERVDLLGGAPGFAGLANYTLLLGDPLVLLAIWHTLYFTVVSISVQSVLGLGIALVLNERFLGRGILRALVFLPWAMPTVANAALWSWIYHPSFGVLSTVLYKLGLVSAPVQWLATPYLAMNMVILADTWKVTPFYAIMFLAALQGIPEELYEAAAIDGAGPFRRCLAITLPLLAPMFLVVLVVRTMEALRVFDVIYVLTGGGPGGGTTVLGWVAYLQAFQNLDFSVGAAAANLMVIGSLIIAWCYARVLRRSAFPEN